MRSFFEAYPFPSLILDASEHFALAGINHAYLNASSFKGKTQELLDQSLLRLFPECSDRLRPALDRVLETKEPNKTDIPLYQLTPENVVAEEVRCNLLILTPVLNDLEEVGLIFCSFLPAWSYDSATNQPTPFSHATNQKHQEDQRDLVRRNLQKRIKEKSCLYNIASLNEQELSIEELLEKSIVVLPEGWLYTNIAEAAIEYDGKTYHSPGFRKTEWLITAENEIRPGIELKIHVAYLQEKPIRDVGPFLKEERQLIDDIIDQLSKKLDQKLVQKELEEKQVLLDKAYQLAHIGIWEFDMLTHKLEWSDLTKKIHGFGPDYEPDVESTINLFKEGINRQKFAQAAREAIEEEKPFDVELKIISGEGDERWIRATAEPEYKNGVCTRFYGISQNVTDRRKAEQDLLLNEQRFRSLVQDGSDLLAILDSEANYKYVSPTSETVLGIPAEDLIETNALKYIHPDDRDRIIEIIDKLSPGERLNISPFRFKNSNGKWRWIETTLTNMTEDAAVGGLVANSRDVTRQKRQEKKILKALKEKETLLAEIHHRVKNNLAVVSGMIQLQITDTENSELNNKLHDSVIRIKTMASIHEQLYQSNSFSELKFDHNIRSLVLDIQRTLQSNTHVQVNFDCQSVHLNINQAIPCSLVVNEVITNIFKHAFPEQEKGNISVTLYEVEGKVHLTIKDDGIGLADDFKETTHTSLGMSLIDVLSQQLGGKYRFESSQNGTTFQLNFQKDKQKGSGNNFL